MERLKYAGIGLSEYLELLKGAVEEWLEYESPSGNVQGVLPGLDPEALNTSDERPEQPFLLGLLRRSRSLQVPILDRSAMNMPYVLQLEIDAVIEAESEYTNRKIVNLKLAVGNGS
jgi:hypothetical protein